MPQIGIFLSRFAESFAPIYAAEFRALGGQDSYHIAENSLTKNIPRLITDDADLQKSEVEILILKFEP